MTAPLVLVRHYLAPDPDALRVVADRLLRPALTAAEDGDRIAATDAEADAAPQGGEE